MSRLALSLVCATAACSAASMPSFSEWLAVLESPRKYAFNITSSEFARRRAIFDANMAIAAAHNAGNSSYSLGATQFADLTPAEWAAFVNGAPVPQPRGVPVVITPVAGDTPPPSVNWTTSGCIGPVRNQGQCGSTWAIAAVEELEWACCLASGLNATRLSVQEVIDCSSSEGGQGCNGGWITDAWQYAADAGGLCAEAAYPYKGSGAACQASKCPHHCKPTSVVAVTPNDRDALLTALAAQPVVLGVAADSMAFQLYAGGVITDAACGSNVNHIIAAVGYDSAAAVPFVRSMNSWGASWGEEGYVRIGSAAASGPGVCAIYAMPSYATVSRQA